MKAPVSRPRSMPRSSRPRALAAGPPPLPRGSHAEAAWSEFRQALGLRQPRALLRLLATVTTLVSYAGRSLPAEHRADACERIAAALCARIREEGIRSASELLHALDVEVARWLHADATPDVPLSTALLVRLGGSLAVLPETQQRALSAHYGGTAHTPACDACAHRQALDTLRASLSLDAG